MIFYCHINFPEYMNLCILPETNSKFAPENECLEGEISFRGLDFFSGAFAVSFREGN